MAEPLRRAALVGLTDLVRPGRPRRIDQRRIRAATPTPPPQQLGVTHWSSRLLAAQLGVDCGTVAAAWRAFGDGVGRGSDDTLFALREGRVQFPYWPARSRRAATDRNPDGQA